MSTKHTPTPWHVKDDGFYNEVFSSDGFEVCDPGQGPHLHETHDGTEGHWSTTPGAHIDRSEAEERSNAAFIVQAVNSHDALVAALREFVAAQDAYAAAKGNSAIALAVGLRLKAEEAARTTLSTLQDQTA